MAMYGADVADLRATAAQFDRYAEQLRRDRAQVANGIRISAWVGPFAASFRVTWDSEHSVRMLAAADRLSAAAGVLRDNATEQDRTSAASGGSLRPTGASGPFPLLIGGIGITLPRGWWADIWRPEDLPRWRGPDVFRRIADEIRRIIERHPDPDRQIPSPAPESARSAPTDPSPSAPTDPSPSAPTDPGKNGTQDYSVRRAIELAESENGTARPTGWNGEGECIKSAQRWINNAGGRFGGGGVVSGYVNSGAVEVTSMPVRAGDVIQYTSRATPDEFVGGVHTVMVLGVNPDGSYRIAESNSPPGSGLVSIRDPWHPRPPTGFDARVWRFAETVD